MIQFHKVAGKPKKISAGQEAIWFTDFGALYVADKKGVPVLISAGTKNGSTIPTGKPTEVNMIYYCSANKTHYIAGDEKWHEIPKKDSGSVGGPTTSAGNVVLGDIQDWYTSVDVEGALTEIGEAMPHFFGKGKLRDYNENVRVIDESFEVFATGVSTSRPGDVGWISSRLASDANTYGLMVDKKGKGYTYLSGTYRQLALSSELIDLSQKISNDLQGFIDENGISKGTIKVKDGILSNGKGYGEGLEISLDKNYIKTLQVDGKNFVKKTGDKMTGALTINSGSNESAVFLSGQNGIKKAGFYHSKDSKITGLYSYNNKFSGDGAILRFYEDGTTSLYSRGKSNLNLYPTDGAVNVVANLPMSIRAVKTNTAANIRSASGTIRLGASKTESYLEAFPGANDKAGMNIRISGGTGKMVRKVTSKAIFTYGEEALVAGSSVHVGMDANTEYGSTQPGRRINSLLCLYPFLVNSESNAHRNYARIGYNQRDGILQIQSFKKNTAKAGYTDRTNSITVQANRFINTSSELYKENIKEIDESVLKEVMDVKPYLYNFKDDDSKTEHAGFIIERNVPKVAVEKDGLAIDQYAMLAYLWKGFQEYVEKTDSKVAELEKRIKTA